MKPLRAETFARRYRQTTEDLMIDHPRKRKNPEQEFQIKLVRDLAKILPPDCVMTAFPAGGGGRVRGAILKAMGLQAGMPDLLFIHGGCAFGMELKAKRGRVTPAQIAMHERLAVCGVDVRVVKTMDDALDCLKAWSIPTRIVGEWIQRRGAGRKQ